jgi:hypothetical protein
MLTVMVLNSSNFFFTFRLNLQTSTLDMFYIILIINNDDCSINLTKT